MALLGSILKRTIEIGGKLPKIRKADAYRVQTKTLKHLLAKAEFTAFGEHYNFTRILGSNDIIGSFQQTVDTHDYNSIFKRWWYRSLNGEPYVCWPDHIKYFALSSGTSEASSKHIPITKEMLRAIKKTSVLQILSQFHYNLPKEHFERGMLMIGGSTHLNYNGTYFEGDLSGITTGNIPFWFQHFYKPGSRISKERDWNAKLEEIMKNAKAWDISAVCGVPAWIQILFEKIIKHYNVNNIHDIWPNLAIYVHGGVHFEPYKKGFEKLLGKPIIYLETYLASEGFIAYQNRPDATGMKLVMNNGIFYEFVPFTDDNFDADGTMKPNPVALHVGQVQEDVEYAILLSTCAGAWRYLIGDTIKFTSLEHYEIKITGRTKHFLSLCGEQLSQDNMNQAIKIVSDELNIDIKEFSVAGINFESLFAHRWYIGTDEKVDANELKKKIDEQLKVLNDDYRVERIAALKEIFVEVLPANVFYDWMRKIGKEGGQNKFPRVLKKEKLIDWENYLIQNNLVKRN
ncbi:MAG: GH3 auxin-responsive promoter family protein [Bacteroidetes bacterium]|nr:GH3 auxin-responsive promoter family protein [Bacteroidota bacterium]